ncbi:MAG: hypothetical protein ACYC2O_02825 [Microthrixaceae bacterium]
MLSAELTPTPPQATVSRRSTRVALRLVLAAVVWLGVMWLASPAGASPADGAVGSAPPVASAAADPLASLDDAVRQTVDATLAPVAPVTPAAPVVRAVEPVVAAALQAPAPLLTTLDPVVAPVATTLDELTAPVLDAAPLPALPALPSLPTLPTLPVLSVPDLPVPALPVPTGAAIGLPGATRTADTASGSTAQPSTTPDGMSGAGVVPAPDRFDGHAVRALDVTDGGPAAASIGLPVEPTPASSGPAPVAPLPDHAPLGAPAPSTLGQGTDRAPSLAVLATAPRAPQHHAETIRLHATHAASEPAPLPPVAPD